MTAARILPLIVCVPLFGAAVLVGGGRRLPRYAAELLAWLFAAAGAALALWAAAATPSSGAPPVEWVGD
ncbi:NADH-quinone oxidoreductase subunit D, partial [Streptomyces sp. MCAF7]